MRFGALWVVVFGVGCVPRAYISVLEPADVALPNHIETLAVMDRSRPANAGQGILGTIEGALTGEAIGADREAGREAVRGLVETVEASPRFEVVVPPFDRSESNLFDRELSWKTVRRICKDYDAQALVSLEALDSDSWVQEDSYVETDTDDHGREVRRKVFTAQRETRIMSAWRVYDVRDDSLLDDLRDYAMADTWEAEGHNPAEARQHLPPLFDTVVSVGYESGLAYGRRIAPTWVNVQRSYFGGGDPRMVEAKRHVKADDWEGAESLWREITKEADPKMRGKAEFNTALALEVRGKLHKALEMAKKAAVDLHNFRSRNYITILEMRILDQQRLRDQMATPKPKPEQIPGPHPTPDLAVPADDRLERPEPEDGKLERPEPEDGKLERPEE
ncbi:MAG: hypothetical protein HN348_06490 [Proteobacteria bacterium]|jgi:hypothetical protein|nr:hypothetical protein [Pseudomonadota bacterium]